MVFSRTFADDSWILEVVESIMVLQPPGQLVTDSSWWGKGCKKSRAGNQDPGLVTLRGTCGVWVF